MKNINLSPSEEVIFRILKKAPRSVLDNGEIRDLFPDVDRIKLNKLLFSLIHKGYLFHLKRGLYLVNEEPSMRPEIRDPFTIASALYNGYLGFSSALRLYNLLDYEPFTVFVVTKNRSASFGLGEYVFRYVALGERAVGETFYNDFYVSSRAKTFFDCFMKPQYAGGYSNVANAMYLDDGIDWSEFHRYFELFASHSLMQRTGYVLELLKDETCKDIPKNILDYLKSNVGGKTRLIPDKKIPGSYIREWMLTDNEGRDKILSWWYNG